MREDDAALENLRAAIEAFAVERAPELVAEARAEALAKVRSMLANAMAEALLDQSAESLGAGRERRRAAPGASRRSPRRSRTTTPAAGRRAAESPRREAESPRREARPEPREPAEASRPDVDELGYYVYGVVTAAGTSLPADLAGVDPAHPATLIEAGGLAAIVSRVSLAEFGEEQLHENLNDVAWLEDKARAHEEVLDAALSQMTVVPMRLCTIYRSEGQVREMLGGEREVFADALRRLEGKTEWGVKLIAEPDALERAASAAGADRPEEGVSEGAAYMTRKRREAQAREDADRVAEEWAEEVHARLASRAAEALLNPLQRPEVSGHTGDMLLNGVYLVDDRGAAEFKRTVDELAEEYRGRGASVELTGPWPPYNFVKSSIEAAR